MSKKKENSHTRSSELGQGSSEHRLLILSSFSSHEEKGLGNRCTKVRLLFFLLVVSLFVFVASEWKPLSWKAPVSAKAPVAKKAKFKKDTLNTHIVSNPIRHHTLFLLRQRA